MTSESAIQTAINSLLAIGTLKESGAFPEDIFIATLYGAAQMPTEQEILTARNALQAMASLQVAGNFPETVRLALLSLAAEAGGGAGGDYIPLSQKGVAGGVATLDAVSGRLPLSQLSTEILGAVIYQGTWNASTNTPTLISGGGSGVQKGHYYAVSTGGTTVLDGVGGASDPWGISDVAIFNGTVWQRIDARDAVLSVNGQTGPVTLTAANVGAEPAFATLSDGKLGDRTADDTLTPTNLGPGTLTQWLGWIANRIRAITGGASWFAAPATTLATTATHIANTSNPHSVTSAQIFSASQSANNFFGAPNGSAGAPTFRALASADIPLATQTLRGAISKEATGTFTPAVEGSTTAGTQTYASRTGVYYLVGNVCTASILLTMSAKDAAMAGDVQISGLPFASSASYRFGAAIGHYSAVTLTANYTQLGARVELNSTRLLLFQSGSGQAVAAVPAANIGATFSIMLTVTYLIA